MRKIFVTVGIITKNEATHIEETIRSVLNSNFSKERYEILIVDGNSTDDTPKIIKKLMNSNKNIRLLSEPWEKGTHGKARNFLVDNSKGKYIAFTDGDCVVKKNWLKILVETLIKENHLNKSIVAVGGVRKPIETKNWKEDVLNNMLSTFFGCGGSSNFIGTNKKYIDTIPNYNAIYLKKIIKKERYSDLGIGEDIEFNLRLNNKGYQIIFSSDAIIYHHQEPDFSRFLKQMYNYGKAQFKVYREIRKIRFFAILALLFVLGMFIGPIGGLFNLLILKIYFGFMSIYLIIDIVYSFKIVLHTKRLYNIVAIVLYPFQHILYGLGVLGGIWDEI